MLLARAGFTVCSGGYYGAMEAVSRGAREAGGHTIGLTTPFYRLAPNAYLAEEIAISRWQDRLFELVERGDGYIVLKGGTGTLLELAALWESLNKRAIDPRPCVAMDFWAPVLEYVRPVEIARRGRTWAEAGTESLREPGNGARAAMIQLAQTPEQAVELLAKAFEAIAK
jgi:uncharacterized protein (TIGR00725 family)